MFNEVLEKEREKKLIDGGLDINRLVNITLVNREGNAVIRRHLESIPLESFDSVSSIHTHIHLNLCHTRCVCNIILGDSSYYVDF